MVYENLKQSVSDSLVHIKLNDLNSKSISIRDSLSNIDSKSKTIMDSISNQKVILKSEPQKLNIPTYEGSGHAVHGSPVYTPYGFNGYKYWMAFTPYPNGDDQYENPSIVASNDGKNWEVPLGLTNPITPTPTDGYNSDTCLLLDHDSNQLVCYYRPVINGQSTVVRKTSSDGVTWSAEVQCVNTDNVLSPQVVMKDLNDYLMVGQRNGDFVSLGSSDGINFTEIEQSRLSIPDLLWHIGMCKTPSGYLFTLCTFNSLESNENTDLFFGSSRNGLNPTYITDTPIIYPKDEFDLQVYQSVLTESENGMRLYMSGQASDGSWNMAYADVILSEPLYNNRGILNRDIKEINIGVGVTSHVFHFARSYNAKEIRVLVKADSRHDFEVNLWQDSTGLLIQPLTNDSPTSIGGIYKADLYGNRFTVDITNNDTVAHDYTVVVLLCN